MPGRLLRIEAKAPLRVDATLELPDSTPDIQVLMDTGSPYNLISQRAILVHNIPKVDREVPAPRSITGSDIFYYGAYMVRYKMRDSWGCLKECETLFYAVNKIGPQLIFGLPGLHKLKIRADFGAMQWRFPIDSGKYTLEEPNQFIKSVEDSPEVYGLICVIMPIRDRMRSEGVTVPDVYREFQDVFSTKEAGKLPPFKEGDHAIDLVGGEPPHRPIYNLSKPELEELRRYLSDRIARGVIRPSTSPAGAPIIFVPKKDGGLRLCVDYRGLNAVTKKNRHPLPLISETLDRLSGARKYIKLDLKDAYYRIRIRPGDEWKTAFRTRYGHFEYLVMPFGLANAPATFQAYINKALAGLIDITYVVYLDDILIFSEDPAQHKRHMAEVLERLRKFSLYINLSKCEFNTIEVEFLGYIVSTEGVRMDPARVATIADWPAPTSFRGVQQFLGFANFYRRFVRDYSKISAPLSDLLKGGKEGKKFGEFVWSESAAQAFRTLCDAFTKAPLLHISRSIRRSVLRRMLQALHWRGSSVKTTRTRSGIR